MYGRRDEDITPENDTPTEEEARELVDRYVFKLLLLQKMSRIVVILFVASLLKAPLLKKVLN